MSFVLRMAVRETRSSWRRLLFFFVCIAVGVAAIVALRSVIQSVREVFGREARSLIAADVLIASNREWTPAARQTIEDYDRHVWQMLVVEELRDPELEFRDPEIEDVLAARPGIRSAPHEYDVLRIVVDIRDRVHDLRREGEGVHRGGHRDEKDQDDALQPRERQLRRDEITSWATGSPDAPGSQTALVPPAWRPGAARSRALAAPRRSDRGSGARARG